MQDTFTLLLYVVLIFGPIFVAMRSSEEKEERTKRDWDVPRNSKPRAPRPSKHPVRRGLPGYVRARKS